MAIGKAACRTNAKALIEVTSQALPVTGRGGLYVCVLLRIARCLDSRLTDNAELTNLTHRPRSARHKHILFLSPVLLLTRR
jgi:hypothetical protein